MGLSPAGKIIYFLSGGRFSEGWGVISMFGTGLGEKFPKTFIISYFLAVIFLIAAVVYKGTLLGVAIAAICSAI